MAIFESVPRVWRSRALSPGRDVFGRIDGKHEMDGAPPYDFAVNGLRNLASRRPWSFASNGRPTAPHGLSSPATLGQRILSKQPFFVQALGLDVRRPAPTRADLYRTSTRLGSAAAAPGDGLRCRRATPGRQTVERVSSCGPPPTVAACTRFRS